ncbi:MAG: rRNA pseudouridine synthase [Spirochaetales bacterium]|nr:rRNA pseudouridine synthase [Spirochaetales bacterium]
MENENKIRLQVYLSRSGVSSRREAAEIIEAGRVSVNNNVCLEPGFRVDKNDKVEFDGETIHPTRNHAYIVLNKPEGYVCSNKDPEGRSTAVGLVQPLFSQRLFTVGRLDINSSGLLILTSDGEFADRIMHPKGAVEREYVVDTQQEIPDTILLTWQKGITVQGIKYTLNSFRKVSPKKVYLILGEGKNREIRNIFGHYKITVRKLHRVRIGNIHIENLKKGEFRKITKEEAETIFLVKRRPTSKQIIGEKKPLHPAPKKRRIRGNNDSRN